jgi:hypothetical protein
MQLNAELIDIVSDFRSLGFIFLRHLFLLRQLPDVRKADRRSEDFVKKRTRAGRLEAQQITGCTTTRKKQQSYHSEPKDCLEPTWRLLHEESRFFRARMTRFQTGVRRL